MSISRCTSCAGELNSSGIFRHNYNCPNNPNSSDHHINPIQIQIPDTNDPWKHRSSGMRCSTCMWFVEKASLKEPPDKIVGRCRRHAPTMNGHPVVYNNDWCGDHKLDETKI